jgi:nucleoside-diphosphate-sugar epimerase
MAEKLLRLTGQRSPVVRATIDKYTEDIAVDSRRIQKDLGFSAQYDLLDGWKETVAHMRRSGSLR